MPDGPAPKPTPETRPFWDAAREGRLALPHCRPCDQSFFYPRPFCPRCWSDDVQWRTASGRGRLVSYIVNHRPVPAPDPPEDQVIALVQLDEGPRMLTNIVGGPADPAELPLDMALEVEFVERGGFALPVFHPAEPR